MEVRHVWHQPSSERSRQMHNMPQLPSFLFFNALFILPMLHIGEHSTLYYNKIVYQPNTKFKEKRNATSQHSAKMKKEKEMSAPSPHLKESFLLLRSKEWAKGEKERRKEKIGENLVFLVGVRDQLQQRLHLVSYPLPPKLQQTHGESEQEDT